MNLVQGRHAFWGNHRPMLSNGPLRTTPIRMSGSFIGYSNSLFMGQDASLPPSPQLPPNRLDSLSIAAIQNRILVAPPIQRLLAAREAARAQQAKSARYSRTEDAAPLPQLSPAEAALLAEIYQNPTSEELDDLAAVDGFFSVTSQPLSNVTRHDASLTRQFCDTLKRGASTFGKRAYGPIPAGVALAQEASYGPVTSGRFGSREAPNVVTPSEVSEMRDSRFFCGDPEQYTFPNGIQVDPAEWFGVNPNPSQTWGSVKTQLANVKIVMTVIQGYPFPTPIDKYSFQWWATMQGDMVEMVKNQTLLDPKVVEYWVTMATCANYSAMVDRIMADLKAEGKRDKRQAMMKLVGAVVASIVAWFLLPAVIVTIASAIKTIVQTYIDIQKRKQAAKDLADASKLFDKDDPAFSKKVDEAATMMDEQAAAEQAALPPTPEMQAAINEVPSKGVSPLAVGGGIAAAGLLAFLVFR